MEGKTSLHSKVEGRGCYFHAYYCRKVSFVDMESPLSFSEPVFILQAAYVGFWPRVTCRGAGGSQGKGGPVTSPGPGEESSQGLRDQEQCNAHPGLLCWSSLVTGS